MCTSRPLPTTGLQVEQFLIDRSVSRQEMSQRDPGGPVQTCIARAEANLRMLLDIPQNYKVLFFQVCEHRWLSVCLLLAAQPGQLDTIFASQGGAHAQFAAVPMNLFGKGHCHHALALTLCWQRHISNL